MPALVRSGEVEDCLREILLSEGYSLSPKRSHGQTGVDLIATRSGEKWHIEAIGYKSSRPARAKDFFESFFRAVSRLNEGARHCVIAVASRAEAGLPVRARQHRVAWLRIATTFPELEIWLVDVASKTYRRTSWGEWAEPPSAPVQVWGPAPPA